jgi:hypothetical protein
MQAVYLHPSIITNGKNNWLHIHPTTRVDRILFFSRGCWIAQHVTNELGSHTPSATLIQIPL